MQVSESAPPLIDWQEPEITRRIRAGAGQGLPRALGMHRNRNLRILDATAGLGRDAYVLAALGARVDMAERLPALQAALAEALRDAPPEIAARMHLHAGDARPLMTGMADGAWDAILLDPMYPDRGKQALPRKPAQWLRAHAGDDVDADELLPLALSAARHRVVVKRAPKAPTLAGMEPAFQLSGSRVRFDVYLGRHVAPLT